jgi:hypothetical protein
MKNNFAVLKVPGHGHPEDQKTRRGILTAVKTFNLP